ncbi:hypothetical protein RN001_015546, partial [Aquatica leii]
MMRSILLTVLLASLAVCQIHDHRVLYGPYMSQCICATAVNVKYAYDWLTIGKFVDDACFKCFLKCITNAEAIAVGIFHALRPMDTIATSYRVHGWAYLMTMNAQPVLAELLGTKTGIAKGKGGSMHMYSKRLFGGNGIVGAQVPQGAGLALAHKYKKDGGISLGIYGDGAANQGQVFESYNIAKLLSLPCVFLCENNKFAMGTSQVRGSASSTYYTRGDYVPGLWVDGNDIFTVIEATKFMIDYCSSGKGPLVVEASTYRYTGHSMSDPDTTYRTRDEIQKERQGNDPLNNLKDALIKSSAITEAEIK